MKSSLIAYLQEYLGTKMPELDSVTQVTNNMPADMQGKLAQGSMAAGLVVLYKFTRSSQGAQFLVDSSPEQITLNALMRGKEGELGNQLAIYSGSSTEQSSTVLLAVIRKALHFVRQELDNNLNPDSLQTYFGSQRQEILSHLPPELGLGEVMQDNTLDDRTNKMDGPISGLAHAIENIFSSSGSKKE